MSNYEYRSAGKWLKIADFYLSANPDPIDFETIFDIFRDQVESTGFAINDAKTVTKVLNNAFSLAYDMAQDPDLAMLIRADETATVQLKKLNKEVSKTMHFGTQLLAAESTASELKNGSDPERALEIVRYIAEEVDIESWSKISSVVIELQSRKLMRSKEKSIYELVTKYLDDLLNSLRRDFKKHEQSCTDLVSTVRNRVASRQDEIREVELEREQEVRDLQIEKERSLLDENCESFQAYRESLELQRDNLVLNIAEEAYRAAYVVGSQSGLHFGADVEVVRLDDLSSQLPSGCPLFTIALQEVNVAAARAFSALVAAGRQVFLVASSGISDDARSWLSGPATNHVLEIEKFRSTDLPDWAIRLMREDVTPGLVFAIATISSALSSQEFELLCADALEKAGPTGPSLVVYAPHSITIEQARLIASLHAAGRAISLAIVNPLSTEVEKWIATTVSKTLIPSIRFEELSGPLTGRIDASRVLREDSEAYVSWLQEIFQGNSDDGGQLSFQAIDSFASSLASDFAHASRDGYGDPARNLLFPFQLVGEVMAMEFLDADADEVEEKLNEWVEKFREQGGMSFNRGDVFPGNAAAVVDVTTPFGAHGMIRISRNWSFKSEEMVTRFGFCMGYVTDEQVFNLENANLQAALWPLRAGLERSWPMPLEKRVFFDGPHSLIVGSMGASERFKMSRWMSVELAIVDDATSDFYQWWGDIKVPIGHADEGKKPLAVWIGYELSDSDVISNIFMAMNGLLAIVKSIDAAHINPRITDELGLIPFVAPQMVWDEPKVPMQGTSFMRSDDNSDSNLSSSPSGIFGSSGSKIGR